MIDLSQELLGGLLIRSFLCGVVLGIFYELIRFVKIFLGVDFVRHKSMSAYSRPRRLLLYAFTFVSDIIFWIVFGIVSIALTYHTSGGVFRGMVYVGMLVGLVTYYFTLGRVMLLLSAKVTCLLKKLLKFIIKMLLLPINAAVSLFVKLYHLTIGKIIGKIIDRIVLRRERKRQAKLNNDATAQTCDECGGEEISKYANSTQRYRKEGRISFGK